jgi:beta-N-acetylhexosaminidase
MAKLPIDFLTGQVLMIGLPADDMLAQSQLLTDYKIGGAAVMTAPPDVHDGSILQFKEAAGSRNVPLLIATDEEGGIVQRFKILGALPSPQQVAFTLSAAEAQQMISRHGDMLHAVGIDMVFGPLADVAPPGGTSPLGTRVFSDNPDTVQTYTLAYVKGWQTAGILPTIKHFPGMGFATGNTDYGPATTPSFSALKMRDFIPYMSAMADTGTAIMVGNQTVPGWFTGPASLSPVVNAYLRTNLGYKNNLIITDSLSANAVTAETSESQAAVDAIAAGNDIALIVEAPDASLVQSKALVASLVSALRQAVNSGTITKKQLETSVLRKFNAQHIDACTVAKTQS